VCDSRKDTPSFRCPEAGVTGTQVSSVSSLRSRKATLPSTSTHPAKRDWQAVTWQERKNVRRITNSITVLRFRYVRTHRRQSYSFAGDPKESDFHEISMTRHSPDKQEQDHILPCEFILTLW